GRHATHFLRIERGRVDAIAVAIVGAQHQRRPVDEDDGAVKLLRARAQHVAQRVENAAEPALVVFGVLLVLIRLRHRRGDEARGHQHDGRCNEGELAHRLLLPSSESHARAMPPAGRLRGRRKRSRANASAVNAQRNRARIGAPMKTVYDAFAATASAAPGHAFLCAPPAPNRSYHPHGVEYTYAQVSLEVTRLRAQYEAAGFGHGHRVALLLENRPEFFFHYLALNALGSGIVPINPDYRHDEMLYQMEHSEADLAVVIAARVADVETVARARAKPLPVVNAEDWPSALPMPRVAPRGGAPGLDAECSLLYTSGTTGRPKGCILTNLYYLTSGGWYRDIGGLVAIEHGRERILNPLPLYHMNCQAFAATCAMLTA